MCFNVKRTAFASEYFGFIGLIQNCMKTSGNSTQLFIEGLSMSSAVGFLASPSVLLEDEKARRTIDSSGRKCLESLERFGRVGSLEKMFSAFLIGGGGWYSNRCWLSWKLRGTRYGRTYCQLQVRERHIAGTGSGLLPTPVAIDGANIQQLRKSTQVGLRRGWVRGMTLTHRMVMGMLPTPTASSDKKGGCTRPNQKRQNDTLAHAMHGGMGIAGKTSHLNPRFVAEMMGFPVNWTESPFLNGGTTV
jgi:hypothetical protein